MQAGRAAAELPAIPTTNEQINGALTKPVDVHLTYTLRGGGNAVSESAGRRYAQAISPANTLLTITVTPIGGVPTTFGPSACTTASCVVSFTALPGPNTIALAYTDGASHTLSTFSSMQIVQPNAINTMRFTASPIVNSVSLSLATTTVNGGTAASVALAVNASDAAGSIIAGTDNYVDANGNP